MGYNAAIMANFVLLVIQNILFIVNPISHGIKDRNIEKEIKKNINPQQYQYKIIYTEYPHHATELVSQALGQYDIIGVIGGDGTVNEVGKALIGSKSALAIIPAGSGNGLARHLGVPVDIAKALKALSHSRAIKMDVGMVNGKPFLVTAGVGFDAMIAEKFASFGRRGFSSYFQIAVEEFFHYEPKSYFLEVDGKPLFRKALMISFANASQFGNDVVIAPKARINDGYLDLVIVKPFPFYALPEILLHLLHGTFHHSSYVETYRCRSVTFKEPFPIAHLDGEPIHFDTPLKVEILRDRLKVLTPI